MGEKQEQLAYSIQTQKWVPKEAESWPKKANFKVGKNNHNTDDFIKSIKKYCKGKKWHFPNENIHFISDLHADADALFKSLIGAKYIKKTGPKDTDFSVLKKATNGTLIIGGDCLDKGPSNLRLLDVIKLLKDNGIKIELLAGNHDIRTFAGLAIGEDQKVIEQHMFVRMGKKTIPLFREIYRKYLHKKLDGKKLLSEKEVEKRLFPSQKWFDTYAERMEGLIPPKKIERETIRIKEKIDQIRGYLKRTGFSHGMLYATFEKTQEIFLDKDGEYAWFFNEMKVAHRSGSFLFVHAGLDDFSTDWIGQTGVDGLNEKFKILKRNDPFELYHGHIGNIFRTKYRDTEFPFSPQSVKKLNKLGIHAIIHGHRNTTKGHRIVIKKGILNFECDTSLDRATRKIEGLSGVGASWLTLSPKGIIKAFSTDYGKTKVFDVTKLGGTISKKPFKKASKKEVKEEDLVEGLVDSNFIKSPSDLSFVMRNIADDLEQNDLLLANDEQQIATHLPEKINTSIKAKFKKKSGELEIKLNWKQEE